jgi:UDP-2,4-diacetamido-2,4,6-trideoxy-beta-L-altropyranose hydrolase
MVRWGFRVSSRPEAGAGHFTRCLALAEALHDDVTIFLDPSGPDLNLEQRVAFPIIREAANAQCERLQSEVRACRVQAAVIDDYAVSRDLISEIARRVFTVTIKDGAPVNGESQFVIRPNLLSREVSRRNTAEVVGGEYALLDKAFGRPPIATRRLDGRLRLLVSFGSRDSKNITGLVLAAIGDLFAAFEHITVVLGRTAPHRATLCGQYKQVSVVRFQSPNDGLSTRLLFENHDLAIGAAGVGLLERMAAGLPSIVMPIAENQVGNAIAAFEAGAAIYGGSISDFDSRKLVALLTNAIANPILLKHVAHRGRNLVDGHGAERAAKAMSEAYARWQNSCQLPESP